MKPAITVQNLSVEIEKQTILNNLSVQIPSGRIIGLLGPSGAGKTTLIKTLVGLQKIKAGRVTILDLPAGTAKLRGQIAYMPQSPAIYPDLTLKQNLDYFATMAGQNTIRVAEVIDLVDLESQTNQLASTLSGGQASRASLAVALLTDPKLLVLDEPTVGVDPVLRQQLWALFHKLAESGITLLITSHIMDEASRCDLLVLLRDGQILATGSPHELREQTKTRSVEEAFLSLVEGAK